MSKENPGWWRRGVGRVARPEEQSPEQAKRAPWILLAFVALVVIVAVGVWALRVFWFEPSQTAGPTPRPSSSPSVVETTAPPSEDGTCTLDNDDRDISTTPPKATQWVIERWAALPVVEGAGPCTDRDGYRVGFAHTQTGALLATYHYFVQTEPSTAGGETRKIAEYALVDGPLKDRFLKRIDDVLNGVEPRHTDADMAKITLRGYRIITYTPDSAVIELLLSSVDGSVLSGGTFKLFWSDGDWRADPAAEDSLSSSSTNVRASDFVPWSPSTTGAK